MKNVVITGGNSGLGYETALKVAKSSDDFNVILACRNLEKAQSACENIIRESNNSNVDAVELNVSSLKSVKNFADNLKYDEIYSLVCNAGINGQSAGFSEDGIDIVFATNHLGHFYLTDLLMDRITDKIFATSSDMHNPPRGIEWIGAEKLAYPDGKLAKSPSRYSYSKLCNLYFIYELAKKTDILVNAFNPGMMKTNFMKVNKISTEFVKRTMPNRLGDLKISSDAYADLIISKELSKSGCYFDRSVNTENSSDLSYNSYNSRELWDFSEKIINDLNI